MSYGRMTLFVALVVVSQSMAASGCGSGRRPEPSDPGVTAPVPFVAAPPAAVAPARQPACAELGVAESESISPRARELNASALVHHQRGDFAASRAGFAAALEASPSYSMAHYNHACALARLGEVDAAWHELLPLLCAALPTFAAKLRTDEDLAAVRALPETQATLEEIAGQYRSLAGGGTPMVSFANGPEEQGGGIAWQESEAGVYVHALRRFLPMGPRVRIAGRGASGFGSYPMAATRYFPARGATLALVGHGNDASDGGDIGLVAISVLSAPLAEQQLRGEFHMEAAIGLAATIDEGGVLAWELEPEDERPRMLRVTQQGASRVREHVPSEDILSFGPGRWFHASRPTIAANARRVQLADGRELELPPTRGQRVIVETPHRDVVLILSQSYGDCEHPWERYELVRFEVSRQMRNVLDAGEGSVLLEVGTDGAIYLQSSQGVRRFEALGEGAVDTLPAGWGLSASPFWSTLNC